MARTVLMIVDSFPPVNEAGTARPFHFAKHLSEFGYDPIVITPHPAPGCPTDDTLLTELKGRCRILRVAQANMAPPGSPDNQTSWARFRRQVRNWPIRAVVKAVRTCLVTPVDLLWATGPPWATVKAAYVVSRLTGKPLVADFRDPWTYGFMWRVKTPRIIAREKAFERAILNRARRIVYTSPLTTEIMQARVSEQTGQRMITITNGFTDSHVDAKRDAPADKCVFCYAGTLYLGHRRPDILFEGLRLACRKPEFAEDVRVEFLGQSCGFEQYPQQYALERQIRFRGLVSQTDSRRHMRGADVLVLLQPISGPGRDVISGKAFEYLAAGKPILAVAAEDGGDAWLIRHTNAGLVTGLQDPKHVCEAMTRLWTAWKTSTCQNMFQVRDIDRFSRRALTQSLAREFDQIVECEHRFGIRHRPHRRM